MWGAPGFGGAPAVTGRRGWSFAGFQTAGAAAGGAGSAECSSRLLWGARETSWDGLSRRRAPARAQVSV